VPLDPDPALVPELLVTDLDRSLAFWRDRCGFVVRYARPEERFAAIALGSAHLLLEQVGAGRNWLAGPLERPFGRGLNLQVAVPDAGALAARLTDAGIALFMPVEHRWYRVDDEETGVEQFVVADPDGWLVRFQSSLGRRQWPVD